MADFSAGAGSSSGDAPTSGNISSGNEPGTAESEPNGSMMYTTRMTRSKTAASSGNQSATTEPESGREYNAPLTRSMKAASSAAAATPSIKTYGFQVRKNASVPQASKNPVLPVASRQSMRIAVANSIQTDRQHQLANPTAAARNNAAATNLRRSARSAARAPAPSVSRRLMSSSAQPASSMIRPRHGSSTTANPYYRRITAAVETGRRGNKKKPGQAAAAKNMVQTELDFSRGIPAEKEGYYRIKKIVTEVARLGVNQYLVEWEGIDPSTGMAWPYEWVNKSDLSKAALDAWEEEKDEEMD
ncbi:hypothetical protein PG997_001884 [Apiospora hydei]|uniref:Chromo domain-containing protein n=1 Tax=Apiospora hydei TaxID=1337664 RepID=A0ABR1X7Z0_9PEZI